jgi:hypothetical protein
LLFLPFGIFPQLMPSRVLWATESVQVAAASSADLPLPRAVVTPGAVGHTVVACVTTLVVAARLAFIAMQPASACEALAKPARWACIATLQVFACATVVARFAACALSKRARWAWFEMQPASVCDARPDIGAG